MAGLPNLWRQQKKKGAGIHIRSAADVVTSTIFPLLVGALVLLPLLLLTLPRRSSLILLVPPWRRRYLCLIPRMFSKWKPNVPQASINPNINYSNMVSRDVKATRCSSRCT